MVRATGRRAVEPASTRRTGNNSTSAAAVLVSGHRRDLAVPAGADQQEANTLQAIMEALALELLPERSLSAQSPDAAATPVPTATVPADGPLFGRTAILRSFVLFNALFAVAVRTRSNLPVERLRPPGRMTCAAYAHRRISADGDGAHGRGLRAG